MGFGLFIITDGSMSWRLGALGELWTSEELRELGPAWTVLNGLRVPGLDGTMREIDHIAIGPGGVFVVDTKLWPSKQHQLDTRQSPEIDKAARKAQRQAGVVRRALSGVVAASDVYPVVLFWGSELVSPEELVHTNRDGVQLIHGRDSRSWLERVGTVAVLDEDSAAAAVEVLSRSLLPQQTWRETRPPAGWKRPKSGSESNDATMNTAAPLAQR